MADRHGNGITVVEHSPEWARQFAVVAAELADILSGLPVESIEHVGSTSVPDLPAKPVLDIDIIVRPGIVTAAVRTLENAGYRLSVPGMAGTFDDCPGVKHAIHVK